MQKNEVKKDRFSKEEKSWIMYDWANSVYATIMMAAVFPAYFSEVARNTAQGGDFWWGLGTSTAMIIIAVMAPIAGAFSDFIGYKKKIFSGFLVLGIGFTFASAFFNRWEFLLIGYVVSHIGFSGSCLIYDSFLSDVTTQQRMDKVSGYGYALGYIGGSTIPFIISIALIMFGENFGIDMTLAIRLSVGLTAIWWAVFAIPFFRNVRQNHGVQKPESGEVVRAAFLAIWETAKKIFKNKKILFFIIAYFFYIDGVGTVITMSMVYGETLNLDTTGMILALFVTQIVAFPCSIGFSYLSRKFGSLKMIRAAVCMYLLICIVGFVMGFGLEEGYFGIETALVLFWILATMVGTVQGGIQAISRSYYCQLIPPQYSGEFFGFFDIFGKFAAVLGPLLYSMTKLFTERSSFSILSIVFLFLVALIILSAGKKYLNTAEEK